MTVHNRIHLFNLEMLLVLQGCTTFKTTVDLLVITLNEVKNINLAHFMSTMCYKCTFSLLWNCFCDFVHIGKCQKNVEKRILSNK